MWIRYTCIDAEPKRRRGYEDVVEPILPGFLQSHGEELKKKQMPI